MDRIRVPTPLQPDEVALYREQGYLLRSGVLAPEVLQALSLEILKFARGEYPIANAHESIAPPDDDAALRRVSTIYSPHCVSRPLLDVIHHPQICGAISQLCACHRAHWDGSAKLVQSCLFVKPPGMQGHAWHQDDRSIATWDQSLCAAWIAIDDVTVENGCLWIVPGSHRTGYLYPLRPHRKPDVYDFDNEAYDFREQDAIPVPCAAGSVLYFSGSLLHSSRPNRTAGYRRVLANHYCNAGSELPWYDRELGRLTDLRSVIPVAGIDPYAAKGYSPMPDFVHVRYRESSTA